MGRVNLDGKVWKDPRVRRLAKRCGWSMRETVGTLAAIWDVATDLRSEVMDSIDIDTAAETDGFAARMMADDVQLGDPESDGRVRLHGVRERIEFLLKQAERGRAGGLARAANAKLVPTKRQANAKQTPSKRLAQSKHHSSLPPDLDLAPDLDLGLPPDHDPLPSGEMGPVGPDSRASRKGPKGSKHYTPAELESVSVVLGKLSDRSGVTYRGGAEHTALIVARLRDGVTVWDMRRVIAFCAERLGWEDKPEMRTYLRPETLFGPKTIAKYLEPARSWMPEPEPTAIVTRPAEMNAPPGKPEALALKPATPSLVLVKPEPDPLDFSGPEWEEPGWMTQSVK